MTAAPVPERFALSPQEAADYLGLSRQGVYNLLKRGTLPSFKIGRSRRIPMSAIRALAAGCADVA